MRLDILVLLIMSYLLGAVPSGLLIVRWLAGKDIRKAGSGNVGTTNVRRAAGNRAALATLICDVLKGALPAGAALALAGETAGGTNPDAIAAAAATAAVIGHMFPVYLRFRPSGKGVATTLGAYLVVAPAACGLALLTLIGVVFFSRRVSAGSLAAAAVLAPAAGLLSGSPPIAAAALFTALLIFLRHRENIQRLIRGTEPRL